jgi:hypothetical protein
VTPWVVQPTLLILLFVAFLICGLAAIKLVFMTHTIVGEVADMVAIDQDEEGGKAFPLEEKAEVPPPEEDHDQRKV